MRVKWEHFVCSSHALYLFFALLTLCAQVEAKSFWCRFYEAPIAEYDTPDDLPMEYFSLNDESVDIHTGQLEVDLTNGPIGKGRFKMAHPGRVHLDGNQDLPPFTNSTVCVKQIYRTRSNGAIARVPGREELGAFCTECNCIRWASILLDLTYKFVAHEIKLRGKPNYPIPQLRYTRAMVAIVQGLATEKAYLMEEWIEEDECEQRFLKYINNRFPTSIVPLSAPERAHDIASFLVFSQHVQWQKTKMGVFVSDYQGAGGLLTDPQITANP